MLSALHIRDFVIVEKADIPFEAGFTVFSGETGAGKSILVDALSLVLGARGDPDVVRDGCERADLSAVFDAPPVVQAWLSERDLDASDGLILRRTLDARGRSRAFINGTPATLTQLRELGEHLVDIHGQHAHQSLLKPAHQRDLLDAQGGHLALAEQVRDAWLVAQKARERLAQATEKADAMAQERERLEWQLADLDRLQLQPGEWQQLTSEHSRLANAQALLDGCTRALAALDDDDASVRSLLNRASHDIGALLRHDDRLSNVAQNLESALIACAEAVSDLNHYLTGLDLDPDALARAENRMSALFETARKLRSDPDALEALEAGLRQKLEAHALASDIDQLQHAVSQAEVAYEAVARKLSAARKTAATRLARQVTQAMQTLAMSGGTFDVSLHPGPGGSHGLETVEFLVAGHAGTPPRPLARVASGGELARLSLALSVIASQAARVPTLIFDEVDSGIGGGVAEVVGRLLRELGQRHQVLCVTHLPQVAACATHHYGVSKRSGATTRSDITVLDADARVQEVARMLGGINITETTRRHAQEMLQAEPGN